MRILTIYYLSAKYNFPHLALARFAFHISHLVSSLRFAHEEAKQLAFFFYAGSSGILCSLSSDLIRLLPVPLFAHKSIFEKRYKLAKISVYL